MPTRLIAIVSIAAILSGCSSLSPPSSPRPSSAPVSRSVPTSVSIEIGSHHVRLIRDYYEDGDSQGRGRGQGRGQSRGSRGLPPGIAKNLQRGKPLPPGIAMQTLPQDIIGRLPHLPSGYEYAVAAGKLLLIDVATHVVHDVLVEALFG